MRTKIIIDLPNIPYEHDISELIGYLQIVTAELTGAPVKIIPNDIDFTNSIDVFRQMRKSPIYER